MDTDFLSMCVNMILSLAAIILLIFILAKVGGSKVYEINSKKYMKIIDRLPITKDNSLIIVKVGVKAYLMSSSSKGVEKIDELPSEDIEKLEKQKENSMKDIQNFYSKIASKIKESKGKRHENQ